MKTCIKNPVKCIGRDCRELPVNMKICCREEVTAEKEIAQNIVDAIEDCSRDKASLQRVSSKLSFGASVINKDQDKEVGEVLPIIKRFSLLLYEFQDKILQDRTISDLTCAFVQELKKWFSHRFLESLTLFQYPVQTQSISADIHTIEIALGVCMIVDESDDDLDDLFF